MKKITITTPATHGCTECGEWVHSKRLALGYTLCRACGELAARRQRAGWVTAPLSVAKGHGTACGPVTTVTKRVVNPSGNGVGGGTACGIYDLGCGDAKGAGGGNGKG